jgi:hypothetical protein
MIPTITIPWRAGYDFGIGADLASGSAMNLAIDGTASDVSGSRGASVDFRIERIKTTSDLEEVLGVSAAANYGSSCFGAGVSARFGYASSSRIQTSSLFMAVFARVELAFKQIDRVALNTDAAAYVGRPNDFNQRFGNMFVRGISSGGMFVGVMQIDTTSEESAREISAKLSGSYGLFSGSAEFGFKEMQKNYRSDIRISMYHEGGPVDLTINDIGDPNELLRNVQLFLQSFKTDPDSVSVPYAVTLAPLSMALAPLPPNQVELEHAQDVIVECAKRRSKLYDQLHLCQQIIDVPARYDFSNGADLDAFRGAAENAEMDLELIKKCASRAMNNAADAVLPEAYSRLQSTEYPLLKMPSPLPALKPFEAVTDISSYLGTWANELATQVWLPTIVFTRTLEGPRAVLTFNEGGDKTCTPEWNGEAEALVARFRRDPPGPPHLMTYYFRIDSADPNKLKVDIHRQMSSSRDSWINWTFKRQG